MQFSPGRLLKRSSTGFSPARHTSPPIQAIPAASKTGLGFSGPRFKGKWAQVFLIIGAVLSAQGQADSLCDGRTKTVTTLRAEPFYTVCSDASLSPPGTAPTVLFPVGFIVGPSCTPTQTQLDHARTYCQKARPTATLATHSLKSWANLVKEFPAFDDDPYTKLKTRLILWDPSGVPRLFQNLISATQFPQDLSYGFSTLAGPVFWSDINQNQAQDVVETHGDDILEPLLELPRTLQNYRRARKKQILFDADALADFHSNTTLTNPRSSLTRSEISSQSQSTDQGSTQSGTNYSTNADSTKAASDTEGSTNARSRFLDQSQDADPQSPAPAPDTHRASTSNLALANLDLKSHPQSFAVKPIFDLDAAGQTAQTTKNASLARTFQNHAGSDLHPLSSHPELSQPPTQLDTIPDESLRTSTAFDRISFKTAENEMNPKASLNLDRLSQDTSLSTSLRRSSTSRASTSPIKLSFVTPARRKTVVDSASNAGPGREFFDIPRRKIATSAGSFQEWLDRSSLGESTRAPSSSGGSSSLSTKSTPRTKVKAASEAAFGAAGVLAVNYLVEKLTDSGVCDYDSGIISQDDQGQDVSPEYRLCWDTQNHMPTAIYQIQTYRSTGWQGCSARPAQEQAARQHCLSLAQGKTWFSGLGLTGQVALQESPNLVTDGFKEPVLLDPDRGWHILSDAQIQPGFLPEKVDDQAD